MSTTELNPVTGNLNTSEAANAKICTLDDLADIVRGCRSRNKIVMHCHGVFDLLHPGHIRHLEAAKRKGDVLVVTVTRDEFVNKGPGRPVFNQRLRAESLAALQIVDHVAINEWPTAAPTIRKLRPDYFVKGSEYADRDKDISGNISDEEHAAAEVETRILFTDEPTMSSTKLLNSYFNVLPPDTERFLEDFRTRYSADKVIEALQDIQDKRVLVVGETIIDEFCFCEVLGKSSKSNAINARFTRSEAHAGGVLAVANQIASFCDEVHMVTCLGKEDTWHQFIASNLKPDISTKIFVRDDAPTIVKRRFTDPHYYSKLFELTFLNDRPLLPSLEQKLVRYLDRMVADYDLVIVADFGHGLLSAHAVESLQRNARFLALNAQSNSANIGYNPVTRYQRADYVCVHEDELRLANHERFAPLHDLIRTTADKLGATTLAVTQADSGSTTYQRDHGMVHTPVFSSRVVDPMGAGDAYLAVTAPCALASYPPELVGFIGNCVGALKVATLGNKECVEPVPLYKFITTLLK